MTLSPEQLRTLVGQCEQFRGARAPDGYPASLALCVIDSVQSTGVTYASVGNVIDRYRAYRRAQGGRPETDGAAELVATFDELGGPDGWAREIGNGNKTSTRRGAPLKAAAIHLSVLALAAEGISSAQLLRDATTDTETAHRVRAAWLEVPGQRSGITWHYVQMLAGVPGVKPDRMIIRFVANALNIPTKKVTPHFALEAVERTAEEMGISPTALDHAIWQLQRRR